MILSKMSKKSAYHPNNGSLELKDENPNLLKGNRFSIGKNEDLFWEILTRLKYFNKVGKIWHNKDYDRELGS